MNLPKNGKIVIVDNDPDEALPLMRVLSKFGHPVSFFSEKVNDLPEKPLTGIRVLFLDMVLIHGEESDVTIISGALKSILDRILSSDNGPFLPIAWTKKPVHIQELRKYLDSRDFHFPIITMEKSECRQSGSDDWDLESIKSKLIDAVTGNESLQFFTSWENAAHDSAINTVNQISGLKSFEINWNDEMKSIILKLAKGYVGKQLDKSNSKDVILNSFFALNGAFIDNLNTHIRKDECIQNINLDFNSISEMDDLETNGMINSKLNLTEIDDCKHMPGNVYDLHITQKVCLFDLFQKHTETTGTETKEISYKDVKEELKANLKHIVLESTPACDYAQNKWRVSRLIPGVLWPSNLSKFIKKNAQYTYCSPVIKYADGNLYHLVFDFRFFTSASFDKIDNSKYLFRIKQELLTDIQSQLSSHVNRPGIISLD